MMFTVIGLVLLVKIHTTVPTSSCNRSEEKVPRNRHLVCHNVSKEMNTNNTARKWPETTDPNPYAA